MLSKGFCYRLGGRIKDFGQRMGHIKVFGVFIFGWWLADPIAAIGKKIKERR